MKRSRGVSTVDLLLLLAIAVLAVITARAASQAYQAHFRFACYENQKALNNALWKIDGENKREIWEVETAYSVKYPDKPVPDLVVIYQPRSEKEQREIRKYPLDKYGAAPETTCPLDHRNITRPVINYWFCWGKWHCLYNKFHSE